MDIEKIINEEVTEVDVNNIELPESMRGGLNSQDQEQTEQEQEKQDGTNLQDNSQEFDIPARELAIMCVGMFSNLHDTYWRKKSGTELLNISDEEKNTLVEPTTIVIEKYKIKLTPIQLLLGTVAIIEFNTMRKFKELKKELKNTENENGKD